MIPGSIFLPFGLLLYGWGAQERLHVRRSPEPSQLSLAKLTGSHLQWITIDIGMGFIAAGMISVFQVRLPGFGSESKPFVDSLSLPQCVNTYLIDVSFARSLLGS